MKKLLLLAWMMVLSIVAMAQTIMVIDKDGNRVPYDPAKVSSVDFQVTPPGFIVNHETASDLYLFDKVQSIKGHPGYLSVDPKVVHVSLASAEGYEAMFAAEVKTNVEYDVKTSDPWIKVARKEADRLVCNVLQHQGNDRKGYVALASKDGLLTDTIKVYLNDEFYVLKCLTPLQSITTVGTAKFMLIEIVNGALRPAAGKTISFSAENGTCSVKEAVTDAQGMVSVDFIPSSDADRGRVQASFRGYFNGVSMMYTSTALFAVEKYELRYQPKQYFWKDGAVTVEFQLMEFDKGTWKPVRATDINFTCENGTLNAQSKQTDEEGKVTVDFAPDKNFKKGSVTASCKIQLIGGSYWFGNATTEVIKGEEYMLEALTPYVNLCGDNLGEIPVQFRLLKYDFEKYEWEPCFDKLVEFNVENGTLSNMLDFTEIDGVATITFQPDQNFVEGSVTAFCNINLPDGNEWHGEAVTKFKTDLYKIKKIAPFSEAVDYYIYMPWDCKYELLKKEGDDYVPCPYQYIQFEATNGSCAPDYALTDAEGKVLTTYTMDDDKDNGSLKASFSFTDAEGNVCIGSVMTNFFLNKYRLECLTPEVEIMQGGMAEIRFQLLEYKKGNWEPCPDKTINFKAENGICTPEWRTTNAEGIAIVGFTPTDIDATLGTVQGDCTIILDPKTGLDWRSSAVALITIIKKYSLECLTPEVEIKKGETAEIRFRELKNENGEWVPAQGGVINFTAENGTSKPDWTSVNEEGIALATFIPAADATEGTLTAFFSVNVNDVVKLNWAATAHITIIDDGTGDRPSKEKAKPKIRILDEGSGGTKPKVVDDNGNGEIVFVVEERIEGEDADRPVEGAKVEFETDNQDDNLEGFSWATTDNSGKASAKFKVKNFAKFKGVKIKAKATVKYSDGEKVVDTTAKVNSDGTLDTDGGGGDDPCGGGIFDSDLKKAYELEQNTFKIGGKVTKLDGPEDMIEWSVTENNEGQKFNSVNWFKEDPVYYTTAWGTIYGFPDDMYGEEIYWSEGSGMSISFGAFIDPSAGYSETNVVDFNSENIQKAVFRLCKDANGNIFAIAYVRSKDGNEGTFKVKAKPAGAENTPCDTGDELLNKADQQDNSVVVKNKTTGATEIRDFDLYKCEFNWTTDNLSFTATITGSDGRMDGELGGFIPKGMVGVANPLTSETFENSPGAKVMFYLQQGSTYIDGEFAKFSGEEAFGNLKPESKIMIRKPCNTIQPANARARRTPGDEEYTDEYEVLIYLVFQNQEWNNETQKMEPGDEYEIYGKCTMVMHTPKVTRFQVRPEKDWVKVGESMKVNLESFAEEGATWDWNDVELVSQSANYNDAYNGADDGFFTWDPATQTVTSLKSNDNKYVWVYFGLKSNPSVRGSIQIATGEGWKYTMIKPSVDEITDHPNSYLSFSFDFAPRDSEEEKIDFNALEIDPATNPDGYFSLQKTYGPQGWPIFVSSKAQPGEYNIRFWIKSNHDVNCTLKVIITPENE